jgi:hypothetical protein
MGCWGKVRNPSLDSLELESRRLSSLGRRRPMEAKAESDTLWHPSITRLRSFPADASPALRWAYGKIDAMPQHHQDCGYFAGAPLGGVDWGGGREAVANMSITSVQKSSVRMPAVNLDMVNEFEMEFIPVRTCPVKLSSGLTIK